MTNVLHLPLLTEEEEQLKQIERQNALIQEQSEQIKALKVRLKRERPRL